MKFKLTRINVSKLYLLASIGVIISLPFFILIPIILRYIIPSFSNVSIVHVALALLTGYFIYNFATRKVSSELIVKLSEKKISIGDDFILKENLKKLTITNKLSYYPKISIYPVEGTAIKFRVEKNGSYENFASDLKAYKYY
ncbi:MAG: hypothetical protein IR153_10105 [Flavobacterium sp.]|nr:hypothetical protein [Flavobacterium sp.]